MKPNPFVLLSSFLAAAILAAVACGGASAPTGTATVVGSVAGATLPPASQMAFLGSANGGTECNFEPDAAPDCTSNRTGQAVGLLIVNRAAFDCAAVQATASSIDGPNFANLALLEVDVRNATGAVATGTYSIVPAPPPGDPYPSGAMASFGTSTATCSAGIDATATSGTVTLTQVGASGVSGSYQLTFGTQGTLSGSFDIPICEIPDAGFVAPSSASPPCMQ